MTKHKSEDYKISALKYYLTKNINKKQYKKKLFIKSAFIVCV